MATTHTARHMIDDDGRDDGANTPVHASLDALADAAVDRALRWLGESGGDGGANVAKQRARGPLPPRNRRDRAGHAAEQLAKLVHDPDGVDYTMAFVDQVARPEDDATAARQLTKLTRGTKVPGFLSALDRAAMRLGGVLAERLPGIVMPVARRRMHQLVGHLVLDAEGSALRDLLADARARGRRLNLNLLGEAVLGEREAARRLDDTMTLLRDPNVDYVSVKASSVVSQLNPWDFDGSVDRLVTTLRPLYRIAAREEGSGSGASGRARPPFINLDMEEYHDLELTLEVFERILGEEEFRHVEAGIVLQAYLPDSVAALDRLTDFAARRVADGGAPLKVRLVKGANLSMETITADLHGWVRAPYATKAETDANYLRLLDRVLRPEHAGNLRVGVASHNLFSMAAAVELARARGVEDQIDAEMLQGMAPAQQDAIEADVGRLILYTPVVDVRSFDVAVSYLVRRLEENAAEENFLHAMTAAGGGSGGGTGGGAMAGQVRRFRDAVDARNGVSAEPRRTQDRRAEAEPGAVTTPRAAEAQSTTVFANEPDTDPALPANRAWATAIVDPGADPGPATAPLIDDVADVDAIVDRAMRVHAGWADLGPERRAGVLGIVGKRLASRRAELLAAAVHGPGKTIAEADPEISEAIDFVRYYAHCARALADEPGVAFTPNRVTVVAPPWNFPVAIPVGGMMAALAAGSAVIISPAPQVVRVAEVAVAALRDGLADAGVDPDLIQLANTDERDAGRALITHDRVDAVILTGASETAALFRGWRPDRPVFAETSGKNAIIVTPAADPDLAARDIVASAFGHAGQKCSAGSLAILVGAAGESERLLGQILDNAATLDVGHGRDLGTDMGPLVEPPGEKLHRGLTRLDPGEEWLLRPRRLDDEGLSWTPGIRDGVRPGSWFHRTECFGPVLGIMRAPDLETAIEWQNAVDFGLTGGIHSLDADEVARWLDRVEVGNAYVNRHITGAIVRRQPFGGWKGSSVGPGAKAGGPNYVAQFGVLCDDPVTHVREAPPSRAVARLLRDLDGIFGAGCGAAGSRSGRSARERLHAAAGSDALALASEFGRPRDESGLLGEANVFRYRSLPDPLIRAGAGADPVQLARTLLAAVAAMAVGGTGSRTTGRSVRPTVSVQPPSPVEPASATAGGTAADAPANDAETAGRSLTVSSTTAAVADLFAHHGLVDVIAQTDDEFAQRVRASSSERIRCLGDVGDDALVAAAATGSWLERAEPVSSGRHEMLHYLREQAISWSMHRFGHVSGTAEEDVARAVYGS